MITGANHGVPLTGAPVLPEGGCGQVGVVGDDSAMTTVGGKGDPA